MFTRSFAAVAMFRFEFLAVSCIARSTRNPYAVIPRTRVPFRNLKLKMKQRPKRNRCLNSCSSFIPPQRWLRAEAARERALVARNDYLLALRGCDATLRVLFTQLQTDLIDVFSSISLHSAILLLFFYCHLSIYIQYCTCISNCILLSP